MVRMVYRVLPKNRNRKKALYRKCASEQVKMPGGILLAATTKHFLYSAFFRFRLFCQISGRLVCLRKLELDGKI